MDRYLLWVEGIDFDEHMLDTNDLSTVRGASLALLGSGDVAEEILQRTGTLAGITVEKVFSGASQALFRLTGDGMVISELASGLENELSELGKDPQLVEDTASSKRPVLPLSHLRFVTGLAKEGEASSSAVRDAHGRARLAQMRGDYPRREAYVADRAPRDICKLDRRRPADWKTNLNTEQAESLSIADNEIPHDGVPSSRSVHARRVFGRAARQRFYRDRRDALGWTEQECDRFHFADNFHDLVTWQPSIEPAPRPAVAGKLAVFYADGDRFGAIRDKLGGGAEALRTFAAASEGLMNRQVLRSSVKLLTELATHPQAAIRERAACKGRHGEDSLRFEILQFGGDELCWVAPAWLGLDLAYRFFVAVADAQVEGHALTFSAGLVFAPYKMPMAESRKLAKEAADIAKSLGGNRLTFHAFESVEPPAGGLNDMRVTLFGKPEQTRSAELLSVQSTRLGPFLGEIAQLKSGHRDSAKSRPFPLSQLHRMLRAAQWDAESESAQQRMMPRPIGDLQANRLAARTFEIYRGRAGEGSFSDTSLIEGLQDQEVAAVQAWVLTHLWDYADPFGEGRLPGDLR